MAQSFYLEQKLAQSDPDFLMSRSFVATDKRACLTAIFALRAELRGLRHAREASVALAKAAWWQEEWRRLVDGQPRHPVTQALAVASVQVRSGELDPALAATIQILDGGYVDDIGALLSLAKQLGRPWADLEQSLVPLSPAAHELWRDIELVALLEEMAALSALGRAPLPMDVSAALQQRPAAFAERSDLCRQAVRIIATEVAQRFAARPEALGVHALSYRSLQWCKLHAWRRGKRSAHRLRRLAAAWRGTRAQMRKALQ